MNKKGFTLIELSIVLVIIGLLIGGILVAQSLVESASVSSFVRQITQYDIAISNFKNNYRDLPGDNKLFTNPGDGDGLLETDQMDLGNHNVSNALNYEMPNFWPHLQESGIENDFTFSNTATDGIIPGVHAPEAVYGKSRLGNKPGIYAYSDRTLGPQYYICDFSSAPGAAWNSSNYRTSVFTGSQALAIDKKMDNGSPDIISGRTIDSNAIIGAVNRVDGSPGGNTDECWLSNGDRPYNIDSTETECCLLIKMFSTNGG